MIAFTVGTLLASAAGAEHVSLIQRTAGFVVANAEANSSQWQDDHRPRVLIMDCCSASTYIQVLALKMLTVHGITPKDGGEGGNHVDRLLKHVRYDLTPAELQQLTSPSVTNAQAIATAAKATGRQGMSLTFKIPTTYDNWDPSFETMSNTLHDAKALGALVWRSNILDWTVCHVRDCFGAKNLRTGYPVTPDGQEDTSCFKGRKKEQGDTWRSSVTKAKLDTNMLVEFLHKEGIEHREDVLAKLQKAGTLHEDSFPITGEKLLDFEYKDGDIGESVRAWKNLLWHWDVHADPVKIRQVLKAEPAAGTLARPGSHRESIYNFEEVKELLEKNHLGRFIRE